MYLNEKAWEINQENPQKIKAALKDFLDVYAILAREYNCNEVYIPEDEEIYLRSTTYTISKWLSEVDIEYKRLYLAFYNKRIFYHPEDEYEVNYRGMALKGGTEAVLNDSFMISLCLDETWKQSVVQAVLFSLKTNEETNVSVCNVFDKALLKQEPVCYMLKDYWKGKIFSYEDLWEKRKRLFPHLEFVPSVKKDLERLEMSYFSQVVKKLDELEQYCKTYLGTAFKPELLSKTTLETARTLQQYETEHTFRDEQGNTYLASWHMRFTGIPGRIFFIPEYRDDAMLICYIGEKLRNATYPT